MKLLCNKSAIPFEVSHFPFTYSPRHEYTISHPIFSLSTSRLLGAGVPRYLDGSLTPIDTRLLFLALLHSTSLVSWRENIPAIPSDATIQTNMLALIDAVSMVDATPCPLEIFPSYAITSETHTLCNIKHWLESWMVCKEELLDSYTQYFHSRELRIREAALEKLVRDSTKNPVAYASRLALWAKDAAKFPDTPIRISPTQVTQCSTYWCELIQACGSKRNSVFELPKGDLLDILDHLEQNLEVGSIYSKALFSLIQNTIEKQDNFLGIDLSAPYKILSHSQDSEGAETASIEYLQLASLIAEAPLEEPIAGNYPSKIEYLRALGKWRTARDSKASTL